jgi:hypothetical protein
LKTYVLHTLYTPHSPKIILHIQLPEPNLFKSSRSVFHNSHLLTALHNVDSIHLLSTLHTSQTLHTTSNSLLTLKPLSNSSAKGILVILRRDDRWFDGRYFHNDGTRLGYAVLFPMFEGKGRNAVLRERPRGRAEAGEVGRMREEGGVGGARMNGEESGVWEEKVESEAGQQERAKGVMG